MKFYTRPIFPGGWVLPGPVSRMEKSMRGGGGGEYATTLVLYSYCNHGKYSVNVSKSEIFSNPEIWKADKYQMLK